MTGSGTAIPSFLVGTWSYDRPMAGGGHPPTMPGATIDIAADGTMTIDVPSISVPNLPGIDISGGSVHAQGTIHGSIDPTSDTTFVIDTVSDVSDTSHLPTSILGLKLDLGGLLHAGFSAASFFPSGVSLTRDGDSLTMTYPGTTQSGLLTLKDPPLVIDIETPNDAEKRAFYPTKGDSSGVIELSAIVTGAPPGATFAWTLESTAETDGAVTFDPYELPITKVVASKAGPIAVRFSVMDRDGVVIGSRTTHLSVPYCVVVDTTCDCLKMDSGVAVEGMLAVLRGGFFAAVNIRFINNATESPAAIPTLGPADGQTIWLSIVNGFVPDQPVIVQARTAGRTRGQIVTIWPAAIFETPFWSSLQAALRDSPAFEISPGFAVRDLYAKCVERSLATFAAHEVGHVFANRIGLTSHSSGDDPSDLMNEDVGDYGATGISVLAPNFPLGPETYQDDQFAALAQFAPDRLEAIKNAAPRPPQFT